MSIPIEDTALDIAAKAMVGLGLHDSALAGLAGVSAETVRAWRKGTATPEDARTICPHLGLDAGKWLALAAGYPPAPSTPTGLLIFDQPCPKLAAPDLRANAYAVILPGERRCAIIDTGSEPTPLIAALRTAGLEPVAVFVTHGHYDHARGLPAIRAAFGDLPAYAHPADAVPHTLPAQAGTVVELGSLSFVARETPGHTPGGITWIVSGMGLPIAFTGDALFAGSLGGAPGRMPEARAAVADQILTLAEETILAPGHGPLTTVAIERARNPFF